MRAYISGPITGREGYLEEFRAAAKALTALGYEVVDPADICSRLPAMEYEEYMAIDMLMLSMCDAIAMLPGWEDSPGAVREHDYAEEHGFRCIDLTEFGAPLHCNERFGEYCFACKGGACSVLIETYPPGESCPFFKTEYQFREDLKKHPFLDLTAAALEKSRKTGEPILKAI